MISVLLKCWLRHRVGQDLLGLETYFFYYKVRVSRVQMKSNRHFEENIQLCFSPWEAFRQKIEVCVFYRLIVWDNQINSVHVNIQIVYLAFQDLYKAGMKAAEGLLINVLWCLLWWWLIKPQIKTALKCKAFLLLLHCFMF